jgi:hypothetical protein
MLELRIQHLMFIPIIYSTKYLNSQRTQKASNLRLHESQLYSWSYFTKSLLRIQIVTPLDNAVFFTI